MSPDEGGPKAPRTKVNRRLLAVLAAAALLVAVLVGTVLTAPISEMVIIVRNWETDTVRVFIRLDDSRSGESHYIEGGQSIDRMFHVSPGTHSVSLYSAYDHDDGVIDFVWTTHVDFDGLEFAWLEVDRDGIEQRPMVNPGAERTPMEQALSDPYVMIPSALLAALTAILAVLAWNYGRSRRTS